jgi:hypothetical protein
MPSVGDYTQLVTLLLSESGKYLALLALSVLAIRLWRRVPRVSGANRKQTFGLALAVSFAAATTGYLSLCHSLGRMNYAYGMRAFQRGNVGSAFSLFHGAENYWKSADAVGAEGVCLLLLNQPAAGMQRLERAKTMRQGANSWFELYYTGIYLFFNGKSGDAAPLLQASAANVEYRWDAQKLLAIILLEQGREAEAARMMEPFAAVEVKQCDHAYVLAWLKLSQNKPLEARAVLDKFPAESLDEFWKGRFEKLRARAQTTPS